jgi:2-oxoglutarate ferredoxin oxidoreductase subunit beta
MSSETAKKAGNGKLVKLTKKDYESDQDVRWCPGCGDYAILATVQRAMANIAFRIT